MFFKLPDLQYFRYEIKERLERLAVKKWINQNPKIIIGITVVCVFVFLVIVIGLLSSGKVPIVKEYKKAWFYDLNTGKLFIAKSDLVPPIDAPSGPLPNGEPAGVKAYVFTYAYEPNESERFIGFLETTDPRAKKQEPDSVNAGADRPKRWGQGKLICRVQDKLWVPGDSDIGRAILNRVYRLNENGETARYCPPE